MTTPADLHDQLIAIATETRTDEVHPGAPDEGDEPDDEIT
jgi:hypothetical protein